MSAADSPLTVKVLTVNVHKGFSIFNRRFVLHELREAVRAAAPDLLFLQEVLGLHHRHAARLTQWPETSQYEFLADTLWSDFAYGRNAVYPEGHHGNAVLSKFPIVRFDNHDVSVGSYERRGLLHCVLELAGRSTPVHAICVHLGLREGHRRRQLHELCALMQERIPHGEPVLVAGDFNDGRLRADAVLRKCGAYEVFWIANGALARTFPARWPFLRLDRIYVRNVKRSQPVALTRRPWMHLSDHAPLAAEIEL